MLNLLVINLLEMEGRDSELARHEAKDGTTLISMKGKSVFTSNEAKNGFGGAIINQADLILIGNQTFSNNIAAYGGALANLLGLEKTSTLLGGESTFTSNSASWGALSLISRTSLLLELRPSIEIVENTVALLPTTQRMPKFSFQTRQLS